MLFDTHCHIQFRAYTDDRSAVIQRCREKNILLNIVGTQRDTSRMAIELAEQFDGMYASIGTHPIHLHPTHVDEEETHFLSRDEGFDERFFEQFVSSPKLIGIGECGLDLWHVPKDKSITEVLAKQKEVFLAHVQFAQKYRLPLVIHCREAHDEMLATLRTIPPHQVAPIRGTIHCYTSDWTHAKEYLSMGFYLGFTGVITFPPKKLDPKPQLDLLEVVQRIPLDRVLVETDAPYLAPQAYRGERSEPWMVEETIQKIASIKQLDVALVSEQIFKNTLTLFDRIRL